MAIHLSAPIGPKEIIIGDNNYRQFLSHSGSSGFRTGLRPPDHRKYGMRAGLTGSFNIPLIPQSEWEGRLAQQIKDKAQLSDIRNSGKFGGQIPALDQNGKGFCATDDTEILTENGWVSYPKYNWIDKVGTMNQYSGIMEFQAPLQKHIYEYNGDMIYSTNRRIDFGVTPDHRMLVRKWDESKKTLSKNYSFQKAGELGWYVGLPHSTTGFIGTNLDKLTIHGDRTYFGDDFLALVSLVVSNGYVGASESTKDWVSFCCFDDKQYSMIASLANRIGFIEQPNRKGVWVRYSAPALSNWFKKNCYIGNEFNALNKCLPMLIKVASMSQITHFLKYYGDQNHDENAQTVFYSSSKRLIDDLQELHLRIGKRGTIEKRGPRQATMKTGKTINSKESYILCVGEVDSLCLDKKKHIEKAPYKGLVYCATVPNGTLITRRNGSILISGNCWAHSSTSAALIVRAINNQPFADLSAYAVACIIKNFRDEGGWNEESIKFIADRGVPTSEFWPQQSMSRANDNAATWANAALHKFTDEWMALDNANMKAQMVTCLLLGIPVVTDLNWWSHSICTIDLVSINPFRTRILNSWGNSWSEQGTGILEGSKAIPDDAIAPRVITLSLT